MENMSRNLTCVFNDNQETQEYLANLQAKSNPYYIPAIIMMSLSIPVGSVGNCLVLIVYSIKLTRTALRTLIIFMSVFNLLISIYVTVDDMYDLLHMWDFNNQLACKLRRYFDCVLVMGSFFVLVFIAITRYRMVCCPPEKRITITQAKVLNIVIAVACLVLAIPYFLINGSQKRATPNPRICGYFCELDDHYINTIWPNVTSLLFIGAYIAGTIIMMVSYVSIGQKVWTHKKAWNKKSYLLQDKSDRVSGETTSETTSSVTENSRVMCRPKPDLPRDPSPPSDNQATSDCAEVKYGNKRKNKRKFRISCNRNKSSAISSPQEITTNVNESADFELGRIGCSNTRAPKRNYSKYFQKRHYGQTNDFNWTISTVLSTAQTNSTAKEKQESFLANASKKRRSVFSKTSWMMATISFVSLVGFVPLLVVNVYKTSSPKSYASLEGLPLAMYHLFYRSYILNSVINPILFSIWDKKFRRECSKLLKGCRKR